ncbi:hypothetical protein PA0219 [Candidatus Phytoplasma australiense]|uniref:Uncharacterized protein n=1 Tax=Phytoplasma australiense TaxID=59748 RepID=B1V9C2_PHYAS|nr:hypothetical protein PA0219 [Candidatus Phytoplasma australiense]
MEEQQKKKILVSSAVAVVLAVVIAVLVWLMFFKKIQLSNVLKTNTEKITLTQGEITTPQQDSVLNKVKKNADSQVKLADITITLTDESKKLKVAAKDSSKFQGHVEYNLVQASQAAPAKVELNTVLKPASEKITLTQGEITTPQQDSVLNKVKKNADSQVKLADVTLTVADNKLKVTANGSSQFKGFVEYNLS